jgi:hypothetical protein
VGAPATHGASPTATPSPSTAPTATPLTGDPLTGGPLARGSIVAVKVDNASLARPYQRGLKQAAIVYQELVEGGSTRFMAIFESAGATQEVGPIRSARESDIDLLRMFGTPALAFSGANSGVVRIIGRAAAKGYLKDASYPTLPSLYRGGEQRRDARNFFAVPARVGTRIGGSAPRDIGWRFGPLGEGIPTTSVDVPFPGSSVMRATYDRVSGTWVLSQGGRTVPVSPANIIIQKVTTRSSGFSDVHGQITPYTVSTGDGRVVLLRDGKRFVGTWRRNGFGVTRLLDSAGNDLLLKAGPTWVMLEPKSRVVSYR